MLQYVVDSNYIIILFIDNPLLDVHGFSTSTALREYDSFMREKNQSISELLDDVLVNKNDLKEQQLYGLMKDINITLAIMRFENFSV